MNDRDTSEFEVKLMHLINECSMESGSNTPDFILAQYLYNCLLTWNIITKKRDDWYGYRPIEDVIKVEGSEMHEIKTDNTMKDWEGAE